MLGLLLICAIFDKFLVVLVEHNGNTKGSFLFFSIVNEIYDYYEARSAISLCQTNELFSHHFWGFKLEIFDSRNVQNLIRFSALSKEYVNDFRYNPVLCPKKIFTYEELNLNKASYSNTREVINPLTDLPK